MDKTEALTFPELLETVPNDAYLNIQHETEPEVRIIPVGRYCHNAAAELRRLHAENESLRQIVQDFPPVEAELREVSDRAHRLEQQRDALLEAVIELMEYSGLIEERCDCVATNKARAAIKAVEEGK